MFLTFVLLISLLFWYCWLLRCVWPAVGGDTAANCILHSICFHWLV